ncbi:MAG: hypothetical protein JW731_17905, partial [Bacteroidales bacterium]|nr:hypothetical protein [Bacteroidales bacterium]
QENTWQYQFEFKDRSSFAFGYKNYFIELQKDFDPTHINGQYLPAGSTHHFGRAFVQYASTTKTMFNWTAEASRGSFYNGEMQYAQGQFGYRYQPFINFAMNLHYTEIYLPEPFTRTKFWLAGPKMDVTFSENIFWTTFVQYNEQMDNMNVNMRFQWRYQPVSDLFLVYTDNYIPGTWNSRNRAIVMKITWWLN